MLRSVGVAVLLLVATVLAGPVTAVGDPTCRHPERLYAVGTHDGHLAELAYCGSRFTRPTVVDGRDWRTYREVFATRNGFRVVVYALGRDGTLLAFPQHASRARLGRPVQVGRAHQWSGYRMLFASRPGYLHGMKQDRVVRTFRQEGWPNGTRVRELAPILAHYGQDTMSAVHPGSFAEANVAGQHLRIWRFPDQGGFMDGHGAEAESGTLPADVIRVTGAEPTLYGIDRRGAVVRMRQPVPDGWDCPGYAPQPWRVTARSSVGYARVVAPARGGDRSRAAPSVANPPAIGADCPEVSLPWEWQ
jgi:hypothetical protein